MLIRRDVQKIFEYKYNINMNMNININIKKTQKMQLKSRYIKI